MEIKMKMMIPKAIQVLRLYNQGIKTDQPEIESPLWIDFDEKKPNSEALCWVKINGKDICEAFYFFIRFFGTTVWVHRSKDEFLEDVTHWSQINDK